MLPKVVTTKGTRFWNLFSWHRPVPFILVRHEDYVFPRGPGNGLIRLARTTMFLVASKDGAGLEWRMYDEEIRAFASAKIGLSDPKALAIEACGFIRFTPKSKPKPIGVTGRDYTSYLEFIQKKDSLLRSFEVIEPEMRQLPDSPPAHAALVYGRS